MLLARGELGSKDSFRLLADDLYDVSKSLLRLFEKFAVLAVKASSVACAKIQ